ncbi:formimidoylglutamase [Corynebacterium sp. HMSC074A01]|uniref:formimidoylglutamase n=1 Tax=Corynebacterium sp. HMSC074A01 TaxID=1715030 RepID=UPI0008A180E2|nr:formimidoylglutamase [Corynebacterium sp. HMSC074A01]OHF36385.1 formimidoylglutamase [Corynebacterium sp. HMSC074A01]
MNTVTAPLFSPAPAWTGRNDGPGPEHARWHSVVETSAQPSAGAVHLIGFASDEGVERNGGRQGAAEGPAALRSALGSLAVHQQCQLIDVGTVTTQQNDLEVAQRELSDHVRELVSAQGDAGMTVVLGGGHETSFATHRGAYEAIGPMQVLNFDAHFDLRAADRPTSGTPFRQIADLVGSDFDYSVFGISRPNNTSTLFDTADQLGVNTVLDTELAELSIREAIERALTAVSGNRPIHLSIDLDVLPAAVAPGVSAPASFGVEFAALRAMVSAVAATGRVALLDVVELNPAFDVDNRTAKAAARLINDAVMAAKTSR